MAVESVTGFPSTSATTTSATTKTQETNDAMSLGKEDFLLLFMESLKNQDPMSPMDNAQMMQQLSQLGQMEAVANLKIAVDEMKESALRNQVNEGAALLGKTVVAYDSKGDSIVGTPNAYRINDGIIEYLVNNQIVQIGQIKEVGIPTTTNPTNPTETTDETDTL